MDTNTTENSGIQCVRCESKDKIKPYSHKTPDKQISKTTRRYTRITTFRGTGGKGLVPVCSQCHRKFTYWKLYSVILWILALVFLLLFVAYLINIAWIIMELSQLPTTIDYIRLVLIGMVTIILFASISFVNGLGINPHNVINIRKNRILIKTTKASIWKEIESYMSSSLLREWRQKTGKKKYQKKIIYI